MTPAINHTPMTATTMPITSQSASPVMNEPWIQPAP